MTDIINIVRFILSVFFVTIMYWLFMPFLEYLNNTMIKFGAPLATSQFLMLEARIGFVIFMLAACFVFFGKIFKREPTTYQYQ